MAMAGGLYETRPGTSMGWEETPTTGIETTTCVEETRGKRIADSRLDNSRRCTLDNRINDERAFTETCEGVHSEDPPMGAERHR
jgi:hypothetical protein